MRSLIAAASLLSALAVTPADAAVRLGILMCTIEGGTAYVVGSNKTVDLRQSSPRAAVATNTIRVSFRSSASMSASLTRARCNGPCFAAGRTYEDGALAGKYYGVNAEASIATGGGVNLLLGGFRNSFTLQPLSKQTQTGLNLRSGGDLDAAGAGVEIGC